MKWKRKGGVATAMANGVTYKVDDSGEFHVGLPSGEWIHDIEASAAEAKQACEKHASAAALKKEEEEAALMARRHESVALGLVSRHERSWAAHVAEAILMIIENPSMSDDMLAQLPVGATRTLIMSTISDPDTVAVIRNLGHDTAIRHISASIVDSLSSIRGGQK